MQVQVSNVAQRCCVDVNIYQTSGEFEFSV